jgi:hypothetical protein
LSGVLEKEDFQSISPEKQVEILKRLSGKLMKGVSSGDSLLMLRMVSSLSFEQALSAMEGCADSDETKRKETEAAIDALAGRLAALDPKRALELGKTKEDPKLAAAGLAALAQKNSADALRALVAIPDKLRGQVGNTMTGGFFREGIGRANGSISEMTAVLKENPQLLDPKSNSEYVVRQMLGQVATKAAIADPAVAMGEVRRLAAELVQVKPGQDQKAAESALVARIVPQMTRVLRYESPSTARAVFNSLADNEKNDMMVTLEAAARFRESGADTALQFAEKQGRDQYAKDASSGVWFSLAQQDRPAAMQWIDSLPPGPFRDGALQSVWMEAMFRSRGWGSSEEAVKAGLELPSATAKLDYFASMATQRRTDGLSKAEFVAGLPLAEAEKHELLRRLAPIKPQ